MERTICPTVLPGGSIGRFAQPASARSCACAEERPSSESGVSSGTCRRSGSSISFFFVNLFSFIWHIVAQARPGVGKLIVNNEQNYAPPQVLGRGLFQMTRTRSTSGFCSMGAVISLPTGSERSIIV